MACDSRDKIVTHKQIACEICGERAQFNCEAIMQTCEECWDIFHLEMSRMEFEQIYSGIIINVVSEDALHDRAKRQTKT